MDLSKAFDCIHHKHLLCKLHVYGVSRDACSLINSYLTNRQQRVKIGNCRSAWTYIDKGVPQGSILGPLLFNVFMNDIFYCLNNTSYLYNYADDNTLSFWDKVISVVIQRLEESANTSVTWFTENQMQANPTKFQCFLISRGNATSNVTMHIADSVVYPEKTAKLLGIHLDEKLNFDGHVSTLCRKAAWQINAMARIAKYLDTASRLKIFYAFILSNFHYCSIIWHFCSKKNQIKLEKLQKRALQVTMNDYTSSYSDLLELAKTPSLYVLRLKCIATETYKCINKISPSYLHDMFILNENEYNLRNQHVVVQPLVRTEKCGYQSFRYQGAKIWNELPNHIKCCDEFLSFINAID